MITMKKLLKGMLVPVGLTLTLILGVFIGTQGLLQTSAKDSFESFQFERQVTEDQFLEPVLEPVGLEFPVNKNGQTYGSSQDSVHPDDYPDLIGVFATNGKEGYVYYKDLYNDEMIFTDAELKELNEKGIYEIYVPVYEEDGKTVIGEFAVSVDAGNFKTVKVSD
jgi:hypothetical protein